ncbi:MAG: hypothetical protein ACTHMA_09925 [Thermomicrobiales bacterium]
MSDLMSELHDLRTRLDATNQRLAAAEQELARARQPRRRHPARVRLGAAAALAVLLALVPLSLFAANPFNDLVPGSVHNANIDAIYNAGITTGCVPNVSYCPLANVTRQEMASFLARTAGIGANKPVTNAARLAIENPVAGGPTYAANDLVRVARNGGNIQASLTSNCNTYVPLLTVNITAPGDGFVLVNGASGVQYTSGTGQTALFLRARNQSDTTGANASPRSIAYVDPSNALVETVANNWVFPVPAGAQTFVLEGCRFQFSGSATINYFNPQVTALYVPFGSGGAGTLGEQSTPANPNSPEHGGSTGP